MKPTDVIIKIVIMGLTIIGIIIGDIRPYVISTFSPVNSIEDLVIIDIQESINQIELKCISNCYFGKTPFSLYFQLTYKDCSYCLDKLSNTIIIKKSRRVAEEKYYKIDKKKIAFKVIIEIFQNKLELPFIATVNELEMNIEKPNIECRGASVEGGKEKRILDCMFKKDLHIIMRILLYFFSDDNFYTRAGIAVLLIGFAILPHNFLHLLLTKKSNTADTDSSNIFNKHISS